MLYAVVSSGACPVRLHPRRTGVISVQYRLSIRRRTPYATASTDFRPVRYPPHAGVIAGQLWPTRDSPPDAMASSCSRSVRLRPPHARLNAAQFQPSPAARPDATASSGSHRVRLCLPRAGVIAAQFRGDRIMMLCAMEYDRLRSQH